MKNRKTKVYWFNSEKNLIFDPGYEEGDIHIYNHDQSISAIYLEEKVKSFGNYMDWDIKPPGDPVTKEELEEAVRMVQESHRKLKNVLNQALENNKL